MSTVKPTTHNYGSEHDLQTLSVWPLSSEGLSSNSFWIIYIHGGAWRDPTVNNETLTPTIDKIVSSPEYADIIPRIAAFASIDYRLSPHPNFPQDRAHTPSSQFRDARHPDHVHDVQQAIVFLQQTYGFGNRYILVGHSCGATLAFQVAMGLGIEAGDGSNLSTPNREETQPGSFQKPIGIAGVEGVYDLCDLRDNHADIPLYLEIIVGAFGSDETLWKAVSPGRFESFSQAWPTGKLAVLAHTPADELVEPQQMSKMAARLTRSWSGSTIALMDEITGGRDKEVGGHDEVWKEGTILASIIGRTLRELCKV